MRVKKINPGNEENDATESKEIVLSLLTSENTKILVDLTASHIQYNNHVNDFRRGLKNLTLDKLELLSPANLAKSSNLFTIFILRIKMISDLLRCSITVKRLLLYAGSAGVKSSNLSSEPLRKSLTWLLY